MNNAYMGIDIGGTSIKWMIVTAEGNVLSRGQEATCAASVTQQVINVALSVLKQHPQICSIGVICPGIIDEKQGEVIYAANLNLRHTRLTELLSTATGLPACLGHDGRSTGFAEAVMGAGKNTNSFVMIPIGTGISAALYIAQSMWEGHTFSAGEIGHTPVIPNGEQCNCGQKGCLEVYASARGIARRYHQKTTHDIGVREIQNRLGQDPIADDVWMTAVEALALSLTHLTLIFDPQTFIIGGGLSQAGEDLFAPLRTRLSEMLSWRESPYICAARMGAMAGMWGAVALACKLTGSTAYKEWGHDSDRNMC
ncbi:ROK family protein [Schaalia sp. lx-100]|uniref:ROK family protein n=1 Tax=Schaalia sp. lx-100 TaxID=2899081 RepID=UPI001E33A97A|nr:ROK family protein [Schaalia sp. lx-100]MCD4557422.1 ROK family protein [Schaalia sp. lx-100]